MKQLNLYLNEALINKNTKLRKINNIDIDIDSDSRLTKNEIDQIVEFFNNQPIMPYKISSQNEDGDQYVFSIFIYYKSTYLNSCNSMIAIMCRRYNDTFASYVMCHTHSLSGSGIYRKNYPDQDFVSFDELLNKYLLDAINDTTFLNSLKKD